MTTAGEREALLKRLQSLRVLVDSSPGEAPFVRRECVGVIDDAIAALSREAQPVAEPVAQVVTIAQGRNAGKQVQLLVDLPNGTKLYAAAQAVAPLNAAEAECDRLAKWLTAHSELWPCMSGSPVDVAIALLSKRVAPLNAPSDDQNAAAQEGDESPARHRAPASPPVAAAPCCTDWKACQVPCTPRADYWRALYFDKQIHAPTNAPSDSNANSNALQEHLTKRAALVSALWLVLGDAGVLDPAGAQDIVDCFKQRLNAVAEALGSDKPEKSASPKRGLDHAAGQPAELKLSPASRVYLVATGITNDGRDLYERFEGWPPPLCDYETLYAAAPIQPTSEPKP